MAKVRQPNAVVVPNLISDFRQALAPTKVSIIEFAESNEYCGKRLYPYQRLLLKLWFLEELTGLEEDLLNSWIRGSGSAMFPVMIAPMIRERIDFLRENGYPHFSTVQLVGGRRSGKGYMTGIAIAYKVWNLIQMDDPMLHYGVDPTKEIYFPIIAASQDQAKKFQFADAYNTLASCKAVEKYWGSGSETKLTIHTPADMRRDADHRAGGRRDTRDSAKIHIEAIASSADTVRGPASMVIVMDEAAHMLPGESRRSGDEVYDAATPSLKQFDLDGMVFMNSSPWQKTNIFFKMYENAQKLEGGRPSYPEHFMVQYPSWEIYERWQDDEQKRFRKALISFDGLTNERKKDPDKFRVEYGAQFAETLDAFLRPDSVDQMFLGTVPGSDRILHTTHVGVAPFKYKGHGDPSSTTANFGIAVGHVEWFDEDLLDDEGKATGQTISMPHVVFDLIDAFYPADMDDGVIDWVNIVMPEIKRLIKNFRPKEWTFDQFDSTHAIQVLKKEVSEMGIHDVRIKEKTATAPVNKRRWDNFKAALYLGRVHAPAPGGETNVRSLQLAMDELKFLQLKSGKVIKQEIGPVQTKDIADCIAEVVDALIGDTLVGYRADLAERRMQSGAEGGYGIGSDTGGHRGMGGFEAYYDERPIRSLPNPARGRGGGRGRGRRR